jgi:hypothetical protein
MMSELRRYTVPTSVPLTAGARFIRGFRRIGIVCAVLVLLAGLVITVVIAIDQQRSADRKFEQATCIARLVRERRPFKMKTYDQTKIDYDESGCPGYSFYGDALETVLAFAKAGSPAPMEYAVQPFFIGLAISLASAAASFLGFWLLGWLCAGFTRD